MDKAIFIDKDGTLISDVPYNVDVSLIRFEKYAFRSLYALQQAGYKIIIVSNQSGVGLNYFREESLTPVVEHIASVLAANGVRLDGFYYCPHAPSAQCACRKPEPGMLLKASANHNIDLKSSWMIGDILNDVEAGNRAGTRTILIDNGNETEWILTEMRKPDFISDDLWKAAEMILSQKTLHERLAKL